MIRPASVLAALVPLFHVIGCEGPESSESTAGDRRTIEPRCLTPDSRGAVAYAAASAPALADVNGRRTTLTSLTASRASAAADAKGHTVRGKTPVIYSGSVSVVAPATNRAIAAFLKDVAAMGGYVGERATTTVTVHVPADKLFPTLDLLRDAGTVVDQSVNAGTLHGMQLEVEHPRERIYTQGRDRLREMLVSNSRIEGAVAMDAEVERLSDEIELMKGALRARDDHDAFSRVTVTFLRTAPSLETPLPSPTL